MVSAHSFRFSVIQNICLELFYYIVAYVLLIKDDNENDVSLK